MEQRITILTLAYRTKSHLELILPNPALMYVTKNAHPHYHVWNEDFPPSHSPMELRPLSLTLMHDVILHTLTLMYKMRPPSLTLLHGTKTSYPH